MIQATTPISVTQITMSLPMVAAFMIEFAGIVVGFAALYFGQKQLVVGQALLVAEIKEWREKDVLPPQVNQRVEDLCERLEVLDTYTKNIGQDRHNFNTWFAIIAAKLNIELPRAERRQG